MQVGSIVMYLHGAALKHSDVAPACSSVSTNRYARHPERNLVLPRPCRVTGALRSTCRLAPPNQSPTRGTWTCLRRIGGENCTWWRQQKREIGVSRKGLPLSWAIGAALSVVSLAPAGAQNLDAGKSGAQIFSQVCASCHRSPRALRGASASFLREHYTTGAGMAAAVATYLSSAGRDPGAAESPAQSRRPPAPINPATANAREQAAIDAARETRRDRTGEPKTAPRSGLLRAGSESVPTEVAKPGNSLEAQTPAAAPPRSSVLEDFEQ
jgi:mono/diheme cytochrome c family protein